MVLVGPETEAAGSMRESAVPAAKNVGAELACIAYRTGENPRPIDFLLPGSGVPERLMADGDQAARNWLRNSRPSVDIDGLEAERGQ